MQPLIAPVLSSNKFTLRQLEKRMASVRHYQHWFELAQEHDSCSGAAQWRDQEKTHLYDYAAIKARHAKLKTLLNAGAHQELLYALNEGVHGNMGGTSCGIGLKSITVICRLGSDSPTKSRKRDSNWIDFVRFLGLNKKS